MLQTLVLERNMISREKSPGKKYHLEKEILERNTVSRGTG
jgi:hypothetical protein